MVYQSDEGIGEDVRSVTAKRGAWSAAGILHKLKYDERVSLQANFDKPGPYTIQFDLISIDPDNGVVPSELVCEAEIEWAVEGNTSIRRISVTDGASISGTGQAVRVVVRDRTVDADSENPGVKGLRYSVAILVTWGTRPTVNQPAILALYPAGAEIAGGGAGTVDFPLPSRVGALSVGVLVSSAGGSLAIGLDRIMPDQSVIVEQLGLGLATPGKGRYDPGRQGILVPLMPGTTTVRVSNFNDFTINAWVYLGIDG